MNNIIIINILCAISILINGLEAKDDAECHSFGQPWCKSSADCCQPKPPSNLTAVCRTNFIIGKKLGLLHPWVKFCDLGRISKSSLKALKTHKGTTYHTKNLIAAYTHICDENINVVVENRLTCEMTVLKFKLSELLGCLEVEIVVDNPVETCKSIIQDKVNQKGFPNTKRVLAIFSNVIKTYMATRWPAK